MTFLQKYELLKKSIPVPAMANDTQSIGCEYSDGMVASKNCFFCEGGWQEDCIYAHFSPFNNKVVDSLHTSNSEKCFMCVNCDKCHSSTYLIDCVSCTDCHFSALLSSCTDCFGCVDLTRKKYCIFNKQFTKEEYFKKVEELKKEKPESILKQMFEIKKKVPHPASQQFNNENCLYGNHMYNSKNCFWAFNSWTSEDSGYIFNCPSVVNCWDQHRVSHSERCYEMVQSPYNYECAFLFDCERSKNCFYSTRLINCTDCFGCVALKNKKYCILNNQLSKEQYEKAVIVIKKELGWQIS